jgi:two-component system, chemotaxis family, response regulator Rcp1
MHMNSRPVRPVDILLVEDNPGDVRLIREGLRDGKILNELSTVSDGQQAMDLLHQQGSYAHARRPELILLDLNLPRKDGREVLREVKTDPNLRSIPIVIITSSPVEEDILKSYNAHANCYITKPLDLHKFITVVKSIEDFWLSIVKLPPKM